MRHFLNLSDTSANELRGLFELAARLKADPQHFAYALPGKTLAMVFAKSSTRTRTSFAAGIAQLGGQAICLDVNGTNINKGRLQDEIACVGSYVDALMARVYEHADLETMRAHAGVPVINGLSDLSHPCQALADLFTVREIKGLAGTKLAYVGDGNNVCNSLIEACAMLRLQIAVATPAGYAPATTFTALGQEAGVLELSHNPETAVQDADIVYTDTWISMGQESEAATRMQAFAGFQVNQQLMQHANDDAVFMHCLPAQLGNEVAKAVFESDANVALRQAANRLHVQKALLLLLIGQTQSGKLGSGHMLEQGMVA